MTWDFSKVVEVCNGQILNQIKNWPVNYLLTDSRKLTSHEGGLFFAIEGKQHDGHRFISEAYDYGVRQFVVSKEISEKKILSTSNVVQVADVVAALQSIARYHRESFTIPIIGITGSNGKTIVKEWLSQLLHSALIVKKNPKSYNSQIGVPLSIWHLSEEDQIGVFEAGISKPDEMFRLQEIIQPTIGIFTNLGSAHDSGFDHPDIKANEKMDLFKDCKKLIYCADHKKVDSAVNRGLAKSTQVVKWSLIGQQAQYNFKTGSEGLILNDVLLPLSQMDGASVENACHAIVTALECGLDMKLISQCTELLRPIEMRLIQKKGLLGSRLIDDSYSSDLISLEIALNYLKGIKGDHQTLILSDIPQSKLPHSDLYRQVNHLLKDSEIDKLIGIGHEISSQQNEFDLDCQFYSTTSDFLNRINEEEFQDHLVLIKGARVFEFERIVKRLEEKIHGVQLKIDLDTVIENYNSYKSLLDSETAVMVMVKALAYGGGIEEIAAALEYHHVDYFGVAYPDEGVQLRKNEIKVPVMVMNAHSDTFQRLFEYDLEPEIYSKDQLREYVHMAKMVDQPPGIHLKIDTGMHRLGFLGDDLDQLISLLKNNPWIEVKSMFSHLAASEDSKEDDFTLNQIRNFQTLADRIDLVTPSKPLRHILNTSGISRFPEHHMDMVRLGIGLYGISGDPEMDSLLTPVAELSATISQIKRVKKGDSVGYGRAFKLDDNKVVGTINIGYADGYDRRFGMGVGKVLVQGKRAPVLGNVCMDMIMVDLTDISANVGDEAIIFGKDLPITELAQSIGTIPYEVLTQIGPRVKRTFYQS